MQRQDATRRVWAAKGDSALDPPEMKTAREARRRHGLSIKYAPEDFTQDVDLKRYEPKLCEACNRVFLNRWVFLRHRPSGAAAIAEPHNPTMPCYTDQHLRRLGMWLARGIWQDSGAVSPLDETKDRGDGRPLPAGHRYSAIYQHERRQNRERGSKN